MTIQRHSYLPDFNLAGLSVDDLIDLYNFVRKFEASFDTGMSDFGRPFTVQSTTHPGCIENTAIGDIVDSIDYWMNRQASRVLDRLRSTPAAAMSSDEFDYRASILLADTARNGDWAATRQLFDRLEADAEKRRAGGTA